MSYNANAQIKILAILVVVNKCPGKTKHNNGPKRRRKGRETIFKRLYNSWILSVLLISAVRYN
jgi:hypothetical protein